MALTEPMGGERLFWKVDQLEGSNQYFIGCTSDERQASRFYIELDYSQTGKYFHITTTDEGCPRSPPACIAPTRTNADDQSPASYSLKSDETVKRYVHVEVPTFFTHRPHGGSVNLVLHATVAGDSARKTARLQVMDHRTHKGRTLSESGWLPENKESVKKQVRLSYRRYSIQPCFIRPRKHLHCLAVEKLRDGSYQFKIRRQSTHQEGSCHMLFTLHADDREVFI